MVYFSTYKFSLYKTNKKEEKNMRDIILEIIVLAQIVILGLVMVTL